MRKLVIMMLAILALPSLATAGSFTYYGPHLGFSRGPDQTVVGGQLQWNGIAPRMAFDPGIDLAFNNTESILTVNGDFHYQLTSETTWQPYLGAGVAINAWSDETGNRTSRKEAGGSFIVGAATRTRTGDRFFGEMKLGFGEMPNLKMAVGWNLRSR